MYLSYAEIYVEFNDVSLMSVAFKLTEILRVLCRFNDYFCSIRKFKWDICKMFPKKKLSKMPSNLIF